MPNFRVDPPMPPLSAKSDITVYHAMPHGLCDGLRRRIDAGAWVDTASVHDIKRQALAAHHSQKDWLDRSQGMDSYLIAMDDASAEVGRRSEAFKHAEGWRRHLHLGFAAREIDPLAEALGAKYRVNPAYEEGLKSG